MRGLCLFNDIFCVWLSLVGNFELMLWYSILEKKNSWMLRAKLIDSISKAFKYEISNVTHILPPFSIPSLLSSVKSTARVAVNYNEGDFSKINKSTRFGFWFDKLFKLIRNRRGNLAFCWDISGSEWIKRNS